MSQSEDALIPIGSRLIQQAFSYDQMKQYTEALVCYQEGIQVFLNALKLVPADNQRKKAALRESIEDYMAKAERVKNMINQMKKDGRYHEQIRIRENDTGCGYKQLFSRFLEAGDVHEVVVEDPYIRNMNQIQNFSYFCAVLIQSASPVQKVRLITGKDQKNPPQQEQLFNDIQNELKTTHQVSLSIEYQENLHDREIRFDNGWIVKIGRGLDYVKRPSSNVSLAFHDYDLRSCMETTVDIFHETNMKSSSATTSSSS